MPEPITPDDLPLPDWDAIEDPTQDRDADDVDLASAHPDIAQEVTEP